MDNIFELHCARIDAEGHSEWMFSDSREGFLGKIKSYCEGLWEFTCKGRPPSDDEELVELFFEEGADSYRLFTESLKLASYTKLGGGIVFRVSISGDNELIVDPNSDVFKVVPKGADLKHNKRVKRVLEELDSIKFMGGSLDTFIGVVCEELARGKSSSDLPEQVDFLLSSGCKPQDILWAYRNSSAHVDEER